MDTTFHFNAQGQRTHFAWTKDKGLNCIATLDINNFEKRILQEEDKRGYNKINIYGKLMFEETDKIMAS